jgi:hypothetical protein
MYNLLQLSYFLNSAPFLKVLIPIEFQDEKSFEKMLQNGIKEVFVIIPNANGLVIHITNLKLNPQIKTIRDLTSIGNPENAIILEPENLYLETNGTQILDNKGMLVFKKDVEKYLVEHESSILTQRIFDTLLESALMIKFAEKCNRENKGKSTSVDPLFKSNRPKDCKACVDRLAGAGIAKVNTSNGSYNIQRRRTFT